MPSFSKRGLLLLSVLIVEYLISNRYEGVWEIITQQTGHFTLTFEDLFIRIPCLALVYIIALHGKNTLHLLPQFNTKLPRFLSFIGLHILFIGIFFFLVEQFLLQRESFTQNFLVFGFICLCFAAACIWFACFHINDPKQFPLLKTVSLPLFGSFLIIGLNRLLFNSYQLSEGWLSVFAWPIKVTVFEPVRWILSTFFENINYDFSTLIIGTEQFTVELGYGCSGIQGVNLFLIFGSLFYIIEKQHFKVSSFKIISILCLGAIVSYLGNILRVSTLIIIGAMGHEEWAMGSFHSYTGTFFFLCLMFCFCIFINHFYTNTPILSSLKSFLHDNPAAPFLFPFVGLMFFNLFFNILTPTWDIWYPIKMLIATAILWKYKDVYKNILEIKFSLLPILIGSLIAYLWVLIPLPQKDISQDFASSWNAYQLFWIFTKVFGSCLIIPLIEELTFRGFLLRALINIDFDKVKLGQFSWLSFTLSSIVFGLMHQHLWAGIVAGALFNLVMYYRKSLWDAIVCHAIANIGVAFTVLYYGKWEFWL